MEQFLLNVNGKNIEVNVDPNTPILWVLRDHLNLVGTKYGCGIAQCGACTVHLNGAAVRSCLLPISSVGKNKVTTIEGLSENGDHPIQKAWLEHDVPQCGYCQSGQIMSASALLEAARSSAKSSFSTRVASFSANFLAPKEGLTWKPMTIASEAEASKISDSVI